MSWCISNTKHREDQITFKVQKTVSQCDYYAFPFPRVKADIWLTDGGKAKRSQLYFITTLISYLWGTVDLFNISLFITTLSLTLSLFSSSFCIFKITLFFFCVNLFFLPHCTLCTLCSLAGVGWGVTSHQWSSSALRLRSSIYTFPLIHRAVLKVRLECRGIIAQWRIN